MPKTKETLLEINLNSLAHNFQYLKSQISNNTKFLAVVKAFAYGSDAAVIAQELEKLGADYFAVAYFYEGTTLRDSGITKPILVLHPQPIHFNTIIERCLEPNLYSFKVLEAFIKTAEENHQTDYPIHIKFNTGLNRLGFDEQDVPEIIPILKGTKAVKVRSILSHLGASEDLNEREFTLNQIASFKSISESFESLLGTKVLKHMCNTSGILNYPEAHFDMVRSGIGLYGFGNSELQNTHFSPIATLKSVISQIHQLNEGDSLGYNRGLIVEKPTRTATIPVGHADGIGRQYGKGKGYVVINGQRAYISGNVCMDMIMVDVTDIDCEEGDEVIVFGMSPTADQLAQTAGTISYELLTAISQRVKRKIIS